MCRSQEEALDLRARLELLPPGIEEHLGPLIGPVQVGPCGLASMLLAPSGSAPGMPVARTVAAFHRAAEVLCERRGVSLRRFRLTPPPTRASLLPMSYRDQILSPPYQSTRERLAEAGACADSQIEAEAADLAALREKSRGLEEQLRNARRDHDEALVAARIFMRAESALKAQIRRLEEIIEDLLHDQAAARAAALIADAEQAGLAACANETEGGAK